MKFHPMRRYLIAGLLVWLPVWITLLVVTFLVDLMDHSLALLPKSYQPDNLLGFHMPGLGVIFSVIVLFVTGLIVTNFLGKRLVSIGEAILGRIPLVRSVYHAVKQVVETLLTSGSDSFRRVFLVEYPRRGLWSIAFQTGVSSEEVTSKSGDKMINIFIPTTPNPTSGYLMMVPRKDAIELEMTVDEALKMVISLGVVQPPANTVKK